MLGSTDIYILAGLLATDHEDWTLRELAAELYVDHTLVHRVLKRTETAGLYRPSDRQVHHANFQELVSHAMRFIAPTRLGELTSGVPAAWAAEPISRIIHQSGQEPPPVWPYALGTIRGQALEPLHPAAIQASHDTPALGRLLAIIDSLRAGDTRVRTVATTALADTLNQPASRHQTAA